jgi:hypothetical protein
MNQYLLGDRWWSHDEGEGVLAVESQRRWRHSSGGAQSGVEMTHQSTSDHCTARRPRDVDWDLVSGFAAGEQLT